MERQQFIELVRSQLSRYESDTTYTDEQEQSRWGSIGALEQLLEILESKKDDTAAEENNPQFLMTEVLPPIGVPIRVFYINFHGVKLNDIMHVLPEYDINDFRVKDDDSFYGLAYGWSRAADEEIAEYDLTQVEV
jgi:hypothetical protein